MAFLALKSAEAGGASASNIGIDELSHWRGFPGVSTLVLSAHCT